MKHKDLTGKRFGRLIVINQLPEHIKGERYSYECLCDCGKTIIAKGVNLRSGRVKSCGCLKHEFAYNRIEDREEAIIRREYSSLKKRNRKFTDYNNVISLDEYKRIVNSPCYFCGNVGSRDIHDRLRSRGSTHICSDKIIHINGVDRIDSTKGYVVGNCIPCCTTCNFAKNTMTMEEFDAWIKQVYEYHCKKS